MAVYTVLFTPSEGSVSRVETTINSVNDFKVYRRKEGDRKGPRTWRQMRRGIADLHRRAQVSQQCNQRYVAALASVDSDQRLEELAERLERPTTWNGKRVRGLHPFSGPDSTLFQLISRGDWTLRGFRNADLQRLLFSQPAALPRGEASPLGLGQPPACGCCVPTTSSKRCPMKIAIT
jgi:hypothetical protein